MFREFNELPDTARVWIYQAEAPFSRDIQEKITDNCRQFCENWEAHGKPLEASFKILRNQFIVLAVNEEVNAATGCSIDKSVALMQQLEVTYGLSLFNRTKVAYLEGDKVVTTPFQSLKNKVADGVISRNTVTFNNLVKDLGEFREKWLEPAGNTWLSRYFV